MDRFQVFLAMKTRPVSCTPILSGSVPHYNETTDCSANPCVRERIGPLPEHTDERSGHVPAFADPRPDYRRTAGTERAVASVRPPRPGSDRAAGSGVAMSYKPPDRRGTMELTEFAERLDDRLDVEDLEGLDYAVNGLQVGPEDATVDRAAFAVDGVELTFETAAEWGADVLVVHHGVSWGGIDRVTGKEYDRIAALLGNDLALYAVHLPLDAHPDLGNAAGLADFLDLEVVGGFGREGPATVGVRARAAESRTVDGLCDRLADLPNDRVDVLDFGPDRIEDVAILTGSGTDWLDEAREEGVDALITGEGKQPAYHEAREAGVNVFLAGHYATETFGVQSLRTVVEDWDEGVETTYIEHPTGL